MMQKKEDIKSVLLTEVDLLASALITLKYSYAKINALGVKHHYTDEELESLEALTARFARVSDILVQKVFRTLDLLDLKMLGTITDTLNNAEARKLIDSSDDFYELRLLRNTIVHEYKEKEIFKLFMKILQFTPVLIKAVEETIAYVKKN